MHRAVEALGRLLVLVVTLVKARDRAQVGELAEQVSAAIVARSVVALVLAQRRCD